MAIPIEMTNDDSYTDPVGVRTVADVRELPESTLGIQVVGVLDDEMALAITRLSRLRRLWQSGNSRITDSGIRALASLKELEELDLEWSEAITDAALDVLATLPRLRYVDVMFCSGLTAVGIASLKQACPTLHIDHDYET